MRASGYEIRIEEEVALLRMDRGKGNAMDGPFLEGLMEALDEAAAADPCGLVLTGSGRVFSAGLNLPALTPLDREGMTAFMGTFREAFLRLLEFPGRTVAAVNGHAVAGGALLACACDHRAGAKGDYHVGVRETALGVGLPRCGMEVLRRALSPRILEEVTVFGRLYTPAQALEMGMLHEIVPGRRLLDVARERAARDREVPRAALAQVRRGLVAPFAERIRRGGDDADWVDTWFSEEAQRRIGETVARLSAPK
jgi:enoyl-CoA hydratase